MLMMSSECYKHKDSQTNNVDRIAYIVSQQCHILQAKIGDPSRFHQSMCFPYNIFLAN